MAEAASQEDAYQSRFRDEDEDEEERDVKYGELKRVPAPWGRQDSRDKRAGAMLSRSTPAGKLFDPSPYATSTSAPATRVTDKRRKVHAQQPQDSPTAQSWKEDRRVLVFTNQRASGSGTAYKEPRRKDQEKDLSGREKEEGIIDEGRDYSKASKNERQERDRGRRTVSKFSAEIDQDREKEKEKDGRISRQLRRLMKEDKSEAFLQGCLQLEESLLLAENRQYLYRQSEFILESLFLALKSAPGPTARRAALKIMAVLGQRLANNEEAFRTYLNWIMDQYHNETNVSLALSLMNVLVLIMESDYELPRSRSVQKVFMSGLMSSLESADQAEYFLAGLEPILMLVQRAPDAFRTHFRDAVDMLVGWQLDPTQPPKVGQRTLVALKELQTFWNEDTSFSLTLLTQFLEDIEAYATMVTHPDSGRSTPEGEAAKTKPEDLLPKIAALLQVFCCISQCRGIEKGLQNGSFAGDSLVKLTASLADLISLADSTIEQTPHDVVISLIVAANESCVVLLSLLTDRTVATAPTDLYKLIHVQWLRAQNYTNEASVSLLKLMIQTVHSMAGKIPSDSLAEWFGPQSVVIKHLETNSFHPKLVNEALNFLQAILNVKHVTLVQESYNLCVQHLMEARRITTADSSNSHQISQAKKLLLFLLQGLTVLAKARNSMVATWGLNPSLVQLLSLRLAPNTCFENHPQVSQGILNLLYVHSASHAFFVSTSLLVNPQSDSPSASHLSTILSVLTACCQVSMVPSLKKLVWQWSKELISQTNAYSNALIQTPEFRTFIATLLECLERSKLARNSEFWTLLIQISQLPLEDEALRTIQNTVLFLCCVEPKMSAAVLARLPACTLQMGLSCESLEHRQIRHVTWIATGAEPILNPEMFRQWAAYILTAIPINENWAKCTYYLSHGSTHTSFPLPLSACPSTPLFHAWLSSQMGLYCVHNKLRTPLGKPTDTFLAIESGLKSMITDEQKASMTRVFGLLNWLESLEKYSYNAFEGCAVILPSPVKATRTFFRTNQNTCKEWLSRIRLPAMLLSQQVGAPAFSLRHGLQRLVDLIAHSLHESKELHAVVKGVLNALIQLKSPEAVTGLKTWLRQQGCSRYELWMDAAAKEAAGELETAASHYVNSLNNVTVERNLLTLGELVVERTGEDNGQADSEFLEEHLLQCYKALHCWEDWQNWESSNPPSAPSQAYDATFLNAIVQFKEKKFLPSLQTLGDHRDMVPGWQALKAEVEKSTLQMANLFTLQRSSEISLDQLENNKEFLQDWIQVAAASHPYDTVGPPLSLLPLQFMLNTLATSGNLEENFRPCAKALLTQSEEAGMEKILQNSQYALWVQDIVPKAFSQPALLQLKLETAQAARKLKCFSKAESILELESAIEDLKRDPTPLHMALCYEGAHLLKDQGKSPEAVQFLSRAAWQWCCNHKKLSEGLFPKCILTLSEWVASDAKVLGQTEAMKQLLDFGQSIPAPTLADLADQALKEDVTGQLIRLAVVSHPSLSEAWLAYGNFCYRQGLQSVREGSPIMSDTVKKLDSNWTDEEVDVLCSALNKASLDTSEITSDQQDTTKSEIRSRGQVKEAIEAVLTPTDEEGEALTEAVVDLWETHEKQRFSALEQAARAYFHYLKLQTGTGCSGVSVTLRLLRLMVRHAPALQPVLEVGLALTPPQPWRDIVPQLLSRLGHPEPYVRRRLTELLCRLAREPQGPQLLAYPAVVGAAGLSSCTTTPQTSDVHRSMLDYLSGPLLEEDGAEEGYGKEDNDNEEEEIREDAAVLQPCYKAMVGALEEQEPALMAHAHLLLKELRRLVLLWDELWLGTLMQQQAHLAKSMAKLQSDIEKIRDRQDWSDDKKMCVMEQKWNILFQPLVITLEALYFLTGGTPETPYETWFQQKYGGTIKSGIERLKKPDWSVAHVVGHSWSPLRQVLGELQKRNYAKSGPASLLLDQLSPALAKLNGTRLPMPGLKQLGLTITSLGSSVVLLPTKTKPKKLVFYGSDGKKYTYLFKGLEDLHLDERIMQFVSITNALLDRQQNQKLTKTGFRARHYAVVPLGPRSGLIQWVDGTTPLYALYKRWQQRQAQAQQKQHEDKVLRPSELFYSKLTPLLQAQGLSPNPDKRADWPLDALKTVLSELMEETPNDLLEKELWCGSSSAGHWWQLTQSYGRSLAVMSVVGYLIGLGDRHLDNVLVDLQSGEIVHIDYNVCFEKGAKLRIPECVPCRLTPNLVRALGPWGVEGLFRSTCNEVMTVLRDNEETLLTLLEAFVYDPLVDWTAGHEPGLLYALNPESALKVRKQKKLLERRLTWAFLAVRLAEMQSDWLTNKKDLLACLGELEGSLETYGLAKGQLKKIEDELVQITEQLQVVQELQASTAHPLHQYATRLPIYQNILAMERESKRHISLQLEEITAWTQAYEKCALKRLTGETSLLSPWMEWTHHASQGTGLVLVTEFLQGVGQTNFVVQCEELEKRAIEWEKRQRVLHQNVLDLLRPYAEIISLHPPSQKSHHRLRALDRWLRQLLEKPTLSSCQTVLQEFNRLMGVPLLPEHIHWPLEQQMLLQRTLQQTESLLKSKNTVSPNWAVNGFGSRVTQVHTSLWKTLKHRLDNAEASFLNGASSSSFENLSLEVGVANVLLQKLGNHESEILQAALKAFGLWKQVLDDTHVLVTSGVGVVSLEAIRRLEAEESSTLSIVESWNSLMLNGSVSLPALQQKMEKNVAAVIQGEKVPHSEASDVVRGLQQELGLLLTMTGDSPLPPGHVLLMGLDGLYETLQRSTLAAWNMIPWKHVESDVPPHLVSWLSCTNRAILVDLLLVERWQSMHGLLSACLEHAASQTGSISPPQRNENGIMTIFDHLQLPLQYFVYQWVRRAWPAFGSWIMHVIVKQLESLDDGTPVTQKESEPWESWRKISKQACMVERWAREEVMGQSLLQHVQSHLIAHQWLQQDALLQGGFTGFLPPLRSTLVTDVNRAVANATSGMVQLQEIQQSWETVSTVVEQRLKWAAGANPDLNQILQAFLHEQNQWRKNMKTWLKVTQKVTETAQALARWEVLVGHLPEARSLDAKFLQIVSECQEACVTRETCPLPHAPQERAVLERLIRLLELGGSIQANWITKTAKEITGELKVIKQQVAEKQAEMSSAKEALQSQALTLRQVLTQHHRLLSNLRTILKTGAKYESQGYIDRGVSRYLSSYRGFSERCSNIVKLLALTDPSEEAECLAVEEAEQLLRGLPHLTNKIYDDLLSLAPLGQDLKWLDTVSVGIKQSIMSAPSKVQEERNAVALSIWRRVRLKLEGRDPDPNIKLSPEQQVDDIIMEAMNRDNLALLYEGWTPWV